MQRIADFLGVHLDDELYDKVNAASNFGAMKRDAEERSSAGDKKLGGFFRKGEVGDWRNHFTPDQSAQFDQIYKAKLQGTGLRYNFGGGLVM